MYAYDAVGNRTAQTATLTSTQVTNYVYDAANRLTGATCSNGQRFQYAYDQVGNRTAQTATITSTQVTNYVYDAANRLTSVNGQAYTWDDNGNLLNDGTTQYAYDQANRLISVTASVTTTQFAYNGDGARLKQIVAGVPTTYTLDLAAPLVQVLVVKDNSGDTRYLYGVTQVGEQQSAGWVYHLSDALGSVRQLVDSDGQVTLARGYTPYGEPLWSEGTGQSAYGYTGEVVDVSTGLVFLRARYMQPTLGIFLARDPLLSASPYRYASGNPINRIDPSGYIDWQTCAIQGDYGTCTITEGDWIYKIAREINAAGVSVDVPTLAADIIALNPQIQWNPDYIQIGDKLTLRTTWINAVLYGHAGPPAPTPQPPTPPVIDLEPWPLPTIPLKEPSARHSPPPELLQAPTGFVIGWGGTVDYSMNGLPIPNPRVTIGNHCYEGNGKVGGIETVWDFRHLQKAEFHYNGIINDLTMLGLSFQQYQGWIYGLKRNISDYSGWFRTNFFAGSIAVASLGGMWSFGLDNQGNENGVTAHYGVIGAGLSANIGIDAGESYTKYEIGPMLMDGLKFEGAKRAQFAEEFADDLRMRAFPVDAMSLRTATNLINLWGSYDWY